MNTRDVQCPNCSKMTHIDESHIEAFCSYCGCKLRVDTEKGRVSLDKTGTLRHLQKRMKQADDGNINDEAYKCAIKVLELNPHDALAWDICFFQAWRDSRFTYDADNMLRCLEHLQLNAPKEKKDEDYVDIVLYTAKCACNQTKEFTDWQAIERNLTFAMKLGRGVMGWGIMDSETLSNVTKELLCAYVEAVNGYIERFAEEGSIDDAKVQEWKDNV